ncbi:MAG: shikimate kinase [Desulfobacterales bacterium]
MRSPNNLFLIGYRCTGKSTVGRSLAEELNWSFADTDSLIVRQQQMSIKEIVGAHGWESFRNMEHGVLKTVCTSKSQVVATGGGIVLDDENVMLMRQSGRIVWLRAGIETIKARMREDKDSRDFRPALTLDNNILEIEESLQSREHIYHRAMDFFVDTDDHDIGAIAEFIIERLKALNPELLETHR